MDESAHRIPRLRRRTRVAVLLGVLAPGTLVEALDAHAAVGEFQPVPVDIGHAYKLVTGTDVRADCGCETQSQTIPNAIIVVDLHTEDPQQTVQLTIVGDATFVPPVSGRLQDPVLAEDPLPPELAAKAAQNGCSITYKRLINFRADRQDAP